MNQSNTITIIDGSTSHSAAAVPGNTILEAIHCISSIRFDAPCGGNGSCGKCKVMIVSGQTNPVTPEEFKLLSKKELQSGVRLACKTRFVQDSPQQPTVRLIGNDSSMQVMTAFELSTSPDALRFQAHTINAGDYSVDDQRAIASRIMDEVLVSPQFSNPHMLKSLQHLIGKPELRLLLDNGKAVCALQETSHAFGCAIDIGTTTVVTYLVDLLTGTILDHRSGLNAQKRYGADVISRIQAAAQDPKPLQTTIVDQLDGMIRDLLTKHGIEPALLVRISIVGNTTMVHMLLGIDPSGIAAAPFIPIVTHAVEFPAVAIGFTSCTAAIIEIPGAVASYVGADITAGIYACGCTGQPKPVLFLDIGTNGEMAVWTGERLVCCSSAAGPAFEGASIHHGTGGIEGAISKLSYATGPVGSRKIQWETIGHSAPCGICGSGIIDAVAMLLDSGLVDDTGAMADPDGEIIIETPQGPALSIVASDSDPVYLTHRDVREVQLAKAAVAAGVHTLLAYCDLRIEDLSEVVIAGGFGSFIDIDHAQRIGLLVPVERSIIKSVGNAAGKGAVMMLLDTESHDRIDAIARGSHYIELSGSAVFMEHYIEQMAFEAKE